MNLFPSRLLLQQNIVNSMFLEYLKAHIIVYTRQQFRVTVVSCSLEEGAVSVVNTYLISRMLTIFSYNKENNRSMKGIVVGNKWIFLVTNSTARWQVRNACTVHFPKIFIHGLICDDNHVFTGLLCYLAYR